MFEEIIGEEHIHEVELVQEPKVEATVVADALLSEKGRATVWQVLLGEKKETGK